MRRFLISNHYSSWCLAVKYVNDQEIKRFEELIPFYVTGTLSDAEHNFCTKFLARDELSRSSLKITLLLKRTVKSVRSERDAASSLNLLLKCLKGGGEALPASHRLRV